MVIIRDSSFFTQDSINNFLVTNTLPAKIGQKQHYVPVVYQKNFSFDNDRYVIVYDLKSGNYINNGKKVSAVDIMKSEDLYTTQVKGGGYDYSIENFFASFIEGNYDPVLAKLKSSKRLEEFDTQVICTFISYQHFRTEKYKKGSLQSSSSFYKESQINFAKLALKILDQKGEDTFHFEDKKISREALQLIVEGKFEVEVDSSDWIKTMLSLGKDICSHFLNCEIEVLHVKGQSFFITNDAPFIVIPPKGWNYNTMGGIGMIGPFSAVRYIPLSHSICLKLNTGVRGHAIKHRYANFKETKLINTYIIKNAHRFIITPKLGYIEGLMKVIDFKELEKIKNLPSLESITDNGIEFYIISKQYRPF